MPHVSNRSRDQRGRALRRSDKTGEMCVAASVLLLLLLVFAWCGNMGYTVFAGWLLLAGLGLSLYYADQLSWLLRSHRDHVQFQQLMRQTQTTINNWVRRSVRDVSLPDYTQLRDILSGNWLNPGSCRIVWGWQEPQVVGGTFSFNVKFFNWNGTPHSLTQRSRLEVAVTSEGHSVNPGIEPQTGDLGVTETKVTLTVYKAGVYRVSVKLGKVHIQGSPAVRVFIPGAVSVEKSAVVSQLSLQVATVTSRQEVSVQLRDLHNNTCAYNAEDEKLFKVTLHEPDTGFEVAPSLQCKWQESTERVCLRYCVPYTGVYTASVTYRDSSLQHSDFTVIVLTEQEMTVVTKHVTKQSSDCYFEARLLDNQISGKSEKPRKVYCYLSPRQLTIKEFYMKIFPRRLHTFRICSATQFCFLPAGAGQSTPCLVIEERCQPSVTLSIKERNLMVAVYAMHMTRNMGGSETFQDKQKFFNFELRKLHIKRPHTLLPVTVCREQLLQTSYRATRDFSTSEWCRNFEVTFKAEEGLDWGGVKREWFELLSVELFDPQASGLFTQFQEDSQGLVLPNHKQDSKMKLYEFAGRIVGKCLYESALGSGYRQLVKAKFARSFLAQMIGLRLHYKYLETDDPDLYNSKVRYLLENSAEGLDLVFSEEEYSEGGKLKKVTELIPGGHKIPVTDSNKLQYLDLLANHRLAGSVKEHVASFLKGLWEIVPDNLLSMFDENELELLLCGLGEYSVSELRLHHRLCGSGAGFLTTVDWLWTILAGFTQQDLARFVQFITGCSQLPSGGFRELQPQIQISPSQHYGSLPTAHTCFNELCLPEYTCLDDLHRALVTAIHEGNQGFGLV